MQGTNLLGGMSPFFTEPHLTLDERYERHISCVTEFEDFKKNVLTSYELPIPKRGKDLLPCDMFKFIHDLVPFDIQISDLNVVGFMHEVMSDRSGASMAPFNVSKLGMQQMTEIYGVNSRFSIQLIHRLLYMASMGEQYPKSMFVHHLLFEKLAEFCIMHCTNRDADDLHAFIKCPSISLYEIQLYKTVNGIYEL